MKELSLNILDIVQNSLRAGAKNIRVEISEGDKSDIVTIKITDDGCGMEEEFLQIVDDPFTTSRTTRKIGLGIPLIKMHALQSDGNFHLESEPGKGTILTATFRKSHIDRQPMGDLVGVYKLLLLAESDTDFEFVHNTDNGTYGFSSREAKEILEIQDFKDSSLMNDIFNLIRENLFRIGAEIT